MTNIVVQMLTLYPSHGLVKASFTGTNFVFLLPFSLSEILIEISNFAVPNSSLQFLDFVPVSRSGTRGWTINFANFPPYTYTVESAL